MAGNGSLRSAMDSTSLVNGNGTHSSQTIFVKVFVPDKNCEQYFRFEPTETVDQAKRKVLDAVGSGLNDPLNYGFFLPPADGRFGKFLGEDRLLRDFGFGSSNGGNNGGPALIEFRYKRRLYKAPVSVKKLKQTHSRTNVKAFIEAVRHGDVERVSRWLDKWLDPNLHDKNGETPLSVAVKHVTGPRCRNVLLALAGGGAHLDFRAHDSQTAMHHAATCGNNDAVEALLDLGASPNVLDRNGATPLSMAIKTSADERIVRRLLFEHAVLNVPDVNGDRELHIACRNDTNVRLVDLLLEYGAEMDTPNAAGNTPLHVSAMFGALECARHLLFRGADRTRLNAVGQTAHQCALINSNRPLADLIAGWTDRDVVPLRDSPRYNNRRNSSALPSVRAAIQRRSSVSNLFEIADRLSSASLPTTSSLADVSAASQPDTPTASGSGYLADTGRRLSVASSSALSATPMHSSTGAPDADGYFVVGEHRVRHDERFVSIQRGPNGYGFVLRGAKPPASSPAATRLAFVPTPLQPSLQFLENVDPAEPAGRAGLCDHDYIVEVNGERVVDATHDQTVELIKRSRNGVLLMRVVRVIVDTSPPATISSPATPTSLRRAPLRRNPSKSLIDEPLYAYPPNKTGTGKSTRTTASPPRHAGTVGVSGGAYLTSQLSGEYADPRRSTPPIGAVSKSASVSNGLHAIGNGTASLYLDGPAADTYAHRMGNGSTTAGRRSPLPVAPPQLRRVTAGAASQVDLEHMFESQPEAARSLSSFPAGAPPNGHGIAQPPFGFTDEAIRSKLRQNATTTNPSGNSSPHIGSQPVVVRNSTTTGDLPSIGTLESIPRVPLPHVTDKGPSPASGPAANANAAAAQRDLITTQALVHQHYMPPPPELPAPTLPTHTAQSDHVSEAILPPRDYDDHFVVSARADDPDGNVFLPPPDYDTEPTSHDAPDSTVQPTAPLAQGVRYVLTGVSQPPPPPPPPAPPAPPEPNPANGFFSDLQRVAFEKQQRRTAAALVNESGDLVISTNSTPNGETDANGAARRRDLPVGVTREHDLNLKAALNRRREVIELSGEDNVARAIETQIKQGRSSAVFSYIAGASTDSGVRTSQLAQFSNVPSSPSTVATKSGSDTSASTSTSGVKSAATTRSNTSQSSPSSSLSASQSSSSVASGNATLTAPRKLPAPLPPPKTSSLASTAVNDAASNNYATLNSSKPNMMANTNTAQKQTSTVNGVVPSTAPPKRDLSALLALDNATTTTNVAPQSTTTTNGKLQTIEKSTKPNVVPSARTTNVSTRDETDSVTFLPQAATAKPTQNASALPANNVSTIAAAVLAARNTDVPTSAANTGVKNATSGANRTTYIAGSNKPNVSTAATPATAASMTKQDGSLTSKPGLTNVQSTQAVNGSSTAPLNGAIGNGKPAAADSAPLPTSRSGSNFKQLAEELRKQYIDTQREQYQRLNLLVTQLTSSANSFVTPSVSTGKPATQTNAITNPNVNGATTHAPVPPPNSPLKTTSA